MIAFLTEYYLWIKALHVIAIICWMAGLLYLPRLLAYHTRVAVKSEAANLFEIMEYRLSKIIIVPAMILSLATGLFLAMVINVWSFGWFHLKLTGIVGLLTFQHLLSHWRKQLTYGMSTHSEYFFRMINEVPAVLLVIIIVCVIIKPF